MTCSRYRLEVMVFDIVTTTPERLTCNGQKLNDMMNIPTANTGRHLNQSNSHYDRSRSLSHPSTHLLGKGRSQLLGCLSANKRHSPCFKHIISFESLEIHFLKWVQKLGQKYDYMCRCTILIHKICDTK